MSTHQSPSAHVHVLLVVSRVAAFPPSGRYCVLRLVSGSSKLSLEGMGARVLSVHALRSLGIMFVVQFMPNHQR